MNATNLYKAQAQADKAARLVVAIDALCLEGAIDPHSLAEGVCEVLLKWTPGKWAALAVIHGINPPSEEVQGMVLEVYASRALSHVRAATALAPKPLKLVKGSDS